jgi:predicted Zn-dependent protease
MEKNTQANSKDTEPNWSDYLSSHPMTAERIRPFEESNH